MTYDDWKTTEPESTCLGCGRDSLHCLCDELAECEDDGPDDDDRDWDVYQTHGLAHYDSCPPSYEE